LAGYRIRQPGTQFNRRTYVRALFASIEAHMSVMGKAILAADGKGSFRLAEGERFLLERKAYRLGRDGRPGKSQSPHQPFKERLLFVLKLNERRLGGEFGLDREGEGWAAFAKAVWIRHRLTHPESGDSADVSDSDMRDIERGHDWCTKCGRGCMLPMRRAASSRACETPRIPPSMPPSERSFWERAGHPQLRMSTTTPALRGW
jgi:hypothetical protein